jgi:esterase/lipase superfamily enzyme
MNLFLKRPDLINGVIGLSGVYDLTEYTKGYFDDDVYFNSPQHYMPNLTDHNLLEQIRKGSPVYIFSGSGPHEDPNASRSFASILYSKGINYELDMPNFISTRF